MGYNKTGNPFKHISTEDMLKLFDRFYWWRYVTRIAWKNYVIDEHTRVIVEMTRNPLMFARSLFRSYQGFSDPDEIEQNTFTKYFVAKMNTKTWTVELLHTSPPEPYETIRQLYKQHRGIGNWCK